ncbi:MAG TPA: glycosyltransferase [Stellaceae bacterium]|nr:glycosyltransferase [Stellaceae bacterium]
MDTHATIAEHPSVARVTTRVLRVGVLVDLPLGPQAGGHVRCWERLAEAARGYAGTLDLTVHFMGRQPERRTLADNLRYIVEPPVFSTERLSFLSHVPDHTDLARWHKRLAKQLPAYDVIHTTDAYFAYARTAMTVSARTGIPIVNSVHTNTPEYARIFTAQTVERAFGPSLLSRFLLKRLRIPERVEARMLRQLAEYQRRCAFALVSRPDQLALAREHLGERAGLLRRGIDHRLFNPARRDRAWLAAAHGIPKDRVVVICAGRLNRGKNVMLLAEAMAALVSRGVDVQLLCAGDGDDRDTIRHCLGARATCPGNVEPAELARLYASADLLAFPSRIEEAANVVLEALASGLPVLVAQDGGMGRLVGTGETGLVLSGEDAAPWVEAIAALASDAERRRQMGRSARRYAERAVPSWADVLAEDLLPRWQDAARIRRHARMDAAA